MMYGLLSMEIANQDCDFTRIEAMRNRMYHRKATICAQRAEIITASFQKHEEDPIVIKRAKAFADILDQMDIYIEQDTLIAISPRRSFRSIRSTGS